MGFISGTKVGSTINIAYYIKRIKNKNHILIILIDAEKVVKKTQHHFMIKKKKKLKKLVLEWNFLILIKASCGKLSSNIIFNSERLDVFP